MPRALLPALVLLAYAVVAHASAALPREILRASPATQEAFFDGLIPALLSARRVPGAVVAVVNGDRVVFAKGYGLSDVEAGTPMDPATTRMRVASISKLVTATAALQLVEQGQLDLDADVNDVLDFEIASPFDTPITLRHLLTHTAGFDDKFLGTVVPFDEEPVPLDRFVRDEMPALVMPPGQTLSYSNMGLTLVGRLVEIASGRPFRDYVQEEVFAPLEMQASSFGVPSPLRTDQARPYQWAGGRFEKLWFERLNDFPAGDLNTTALEMARFAIAHLNQGRYRGRSILSPEGVARMHAQQFTHDPRLPGWTLGFAEQRLADGRRAIGHGGWVIGFRSQLLLLPAEKLALFVSVNAEPAGDFFGDLFEALDPWPDEAPPAGFDGEPADGWQGTFVPNRRVRATFLRSLALGQWVRMQSGEAGVLTMSGPLVPTTHWQLVESDRARRIGGHGEMVVRRDPFGGQPQIVMGAVAYDRVEGLDDPRWHIAVWLASVLLGLGSLGGWVIGGIGRVLGGAESPRSPGLRWLGVLTAALLVAIPLGFLLYVNGARSVLRLWLGVPLGLHVVLWLPLVLAVLALALAAKAGGGFRPRVSAPLARLHVLALVLVSLALVASTWMLRMRGPGSW